MTDYKDVQYGIMHKDGRVMSIFHTGLSQEEAQAVLDREARRQNIPDGDWLLARMEEVKP